MLTKSNTLIINLITITFLCLALVTFSNPLNFSKDLIEGDICYSKLYPKKKNDILLPTTHYNHCYSNCKQEAIIDEKENGAENKNKKVDYDDYREYQNVKYNYNDEKLDKCNSDCVTSTKNNIKIFCMQAKIRDDATKDPEEHDHYHEHDHDDEFYQNVHDDL